MTDTTTKVREHYSATDLTEPDQVGACGDRGRRADVDGRSARSTRPVPYARHPRHRGIGHRRWARAIDARAGSRLRHRRPGALSRAPPSVVR